MKKNILLLISLFSLSSIVFGGDFSFTSDETHISISPVDTTVVLKAIVKNTSNQNIDIYAIRTIKQMPRSWNSNMCFGLCYDAGINQTNTITFYPDDEIAFEIDINVDGSESGEAIIDITMQGGNGESIKLTFNLATLQTSIQNDFPLVEKYQLFDNYPNPFNPATTINYSLHKKAFVEIKVFDLLGNHVAKLVSSEKSPGIHVKRWNGRNEQGLLQAAGIYYYQMIVIQNNQIQNSTTKKMVFMK